MVGFSHAVFMVIAKRNGPHLQCLQTCGRILRKGRNLYPLTVLLVLAAAVLGPSCRQGDKEASKLYFGSGLNYFGQQKFDVAAIQFRNAIRKEPRAWAAHYYMALSATKLGRWQDAYQELKAVVELQPSFAAARLELAELLLPSNKTIEAREQVRAVLALNPTSVRAQALLAQTYLLEKDYPRAIEEFEKAKQLAPQDPALWLACGLANLGALQYVVAEQDFRRAIGIDPRSVEAYRNLANLFRLTGRTAEVEPLLRQAVKVPRSLGLYLTLADFYFQQGSIHGTEELFAQMRGRKADFPNLAMELGDFWMWRNELARAVKEYEVAVVEAPGPLVRKKLISGYITLGRWNEAERLNQQILAQTPKDLEGISFRGALRHLRGDSAGAVEELRAVVKQEPKSLFANYYLGMALMGSGRAHEAEAAFVDCIRFNPDFAQAFQRLAELHLQRQDWNAGMEYAKRVVALTPQRPDGYLLVAQAYLSKGDAPRAETLLRQVQKLAPDSGDVQELLGAAEIREGKIGAGVRDYQQAWARTPDPVERISRFVDLLSGLRKLDAAVRPIQQLIAANPQPGYYEILARLYLAEGDVAASEAACWQALRLDSSRSAPHFYLGEVYTRLQRPEEALAQYDEVIRRQPNQIPSYVLAGDICMRQGKFDRARLYYEAAQNRDPHSVLVEQSLARLWAEEGSHLDQGLVAVEELQRSFPADPYVTDTLAWIYYRRGMYTSALPFLRRCVEQQPENALFHFHLGMTYAKAGETTLSRQELRNALRLGLDSARWETTARDALARSQARAVPADLSSERGAL